MKNLFLFLGLTAILGFTSCTSEDQKVVKQLADGEWEVTRIVVNGVAQPDSAFAGAKYTFEECKVKNEACSGKYTYNDPTKGATTSNFTYSVSDDGNTFSITQEVLSIGVTIDADIVEASDNRFTWSYTDDFGDETETTIEKI